MLSIQHPCSLPCVLVAVLELIEHLGSDLLALDDPVLPGQPLRVLPTDICSLVLKVEHQPQFEARVRDCESDVLPQGSVDCALDVRMLVHIKYALYFVVQRSCPPSGAVVVDIPARSIDESLRDRARLAHIDPDAVTMATGQLFEVLRLRHLALGVDTDHSAKRLGLSRPPDLTTSASTHSPLGTRAFLNDASPTTGIAP